MRRFALAFFFALGLFWALTPHLPAVPGGGGGPGFGAERAYLDAVGAGAGLAAPALPAVQAVSSRVWRRGGTLRVLAPPPLPVRRRFLQLMRLQLEGG